MSRIQYQLLSDLQEQAFHRLSVFRRDGVLAGGTALSLQIAHRYSYDFDVFFQRALESKDLAKLKRIFDLREVWLNTKELLQVTTQDNIKVHFVAYRFKSLYKFAQTESLPLLALKDIAADKAYTIGRWATWRDYVDIFWLLKDGHIEGLELVKLACKKFGPEFNPRLFLEQLSFFKDITPVKISFVQKKYPDSEIKKFLTSAARQLLKKL